MTKDQVARWVALPRALAPALVNQPSPDTWVPVQSFMAEILGDTEMWSKNKRRPDTNEREHIALVKQMDCGVCGARGPCDAHELTQSQWFTSIPLCKDCHQGSHNGIHGEKRIWSVLKKDELSVLNETIELLLYGRTR